MAKTETAAPKKEKKPKKGKTEANAKRFPKIPRRRNQIPRGAHRGMRLLLIEAVPSLGNQGEVVEVKPGYGRNFLIPQGLATYVTNAAMARIEKHKAKVEALRIAKLADLKVLAKELEKQSVTIEANANEESHLYGSVTGADICAALDRTKFPLTEANIKLDGPIKELGLYHVKVHLADEVQTEIKVWVVPTAGKASETPA